MTSSILFLLIGFAGLVAGGELLLRGAVSCARTFRISPMIIGLTLVGFGTSTPELVTSLQAALAGSPGIAFGNVIGSNIGNSLLILGLAALLAPVVVNPDAFKRDGMVMAIATGMCALVILRGDMGRIEGGVFLLALAGYLAFTLIQEKRSQKSAAAQMYEGEAELTPSADYSLGIALLLALAGLVITILGARFLVSGAVSIAQFMGISQTVIGLTIVAIGTSMPELVTTVIAVRKGEGEVALGNVLGSNIFNILGILGVTSLVSPMVVPAEIIRFDIWVMILATALMVFVARTSWRIGRIEGCVMLCAYIGYIAWLLLNAGT